MSRVKRPTKRTKILATVGPSCETEDKIKALIKAGVDVFRFNLKHNEIEWHCEKMELVQKCADDLEVPVAIMFDLMGRDLRLGKIPGGGVQIKKNEIITFADEYDCKINEIPIREFPAYKNLKPGYKFSADSGMLQFEVTEKNKHCFKAKVLKTGYLKTNKGVNFPDLDIDLPALMERDLKNLSGAAKHDIDFVALSFVNTKDDLILLKKVLKEYKINAKVASKVESTLGIKNFDEILAESDLIIVARGDLGVEANIEKIPVLQKMMVKKCLAAGVPVMVATQMMESMLDNPLPNRSDVTDVANTVFEYADSAWLSGETAAGNYPVETVETMTKIIIEAEAAVPKLQLPNKSLDRMEAIVQSAVQLSYLQPEGDPAPSKIVVITESGRSARLLSRYHPRLPIIALTPDMNVRDQLCASWGVEPYYFDLTNKKFKFADVFDFLKEEKLVKKGELVILVAGGIEGEEGRTRMVSLKEVWE